MGRLVRRKGIKQLIEAFAVLIHTNPDARLIIAGDGPDRPKLERLANRLKVADKTKFLGFIDEKDKPALLAGAAIACFPSLYGESFGVVLAEAMAAGAGVVLAGDNPGYRCVMEDQPLLLIDPNQTAALSDRLAKLLNDRKLSNQLHRWQLEHVKRYDIDVVGRQILEVYKRLIAKKQLNVDN